MGTMTQAQWQAETDQDTVIITMTIPCTLHDHINSVASAHDIPFDRLLWYLTRVGIEQVSLHWQGLDS